MNELPTGGSRFVDQNAFIPTRRSLLSRLKSWDNQDSWREFFDTYWRLVYNFALKAGLDDTGAQDAVQETVISVAKQMPGFKYDPAFARQLLVDIWKWKTGRTTPEQLGWVMTG